MVPFASPHKTVLFKDIHDLVRHAVFVWNLRLAFWRLPQPVIGSGDVEIDSRRIGVHAVLPGVFNRTAGKRSGARIGRTFYGIRKGLDFIENSLHTLRSGGIAIHTTEFNYLDDEHTIDDWPTVLFQKRHFRELAERLESQGHRVAPLDFDVGNKPLDTFIDLPPYHHNWNSYQRDIWKDEIQHIKVSVDGFAVTCFGIIIRKA